MTTPAWAIFSPATGRWEQACDNCVAELHPVWLPGHQAWAAWRDGRPVVLVPQHAGDGLARGDSCALCPRHARHALWTGTEWDRRYEPGAHQSREDGRGGERAGWRSATPSITLTGKGKAGQTMEPEPVPVLPAPARVHELTLLR